MWSLFWPVWSHDLFPGNLVTWSLSWQSGNVISFLSGHVISFLANLVTWSLSWPICSCDLFPGQSGHVVSFLANLVMWSLSWPRWSCDLFPIANLVTWSLSWTNLVTWSESYGKRLPACLKSDIQTSWATPPPFHHFPPLHACNSCQNIKTAVLVSNSLCFVWVGESWDILTEFFCLSVCLSVWGAESNLELLSFKYERIKVKYY